MGLWPFCCMRVYGGLQRPAGAVREVSSLWGLQGGCGPLGRLEGPGKGCESQGDYVTHGRDMVLVGLYGVGREVLGSYGTGEGYGGLTGS